MRALASGTIRFGVCLLGVCLIAPASDEKAPDPKYTKDDSKRIGGLLSNRKTTSVEGAHRTPLSTKEKFRMATLDAFDPSAFLNTAILSSISQLEHQYPTIPLGAKGYAQRFGLGFADSMTSTYFVEAIVPTLTRQDPRYFRKGTGGGWHRTAYALSRFWVIRSSQDRLRPNGPEIFGNLAAASVGNLYYPSAERSFRNTIVRFGIGIGTDSGSLVLREFWPDIARHLRHSKH